jgi:surfeit locus 1 family protein
VYRFLLKPRWILTLLFGLACVVVFVYLGLWQLARLDERRTQNAEVKAAEAQEAVSMSELLPAGTGSTPEQVEAAQYRSVGLSGRYRVDQQVLVTNRSNAGAPGYWVLTPLVQDDGTAVVVNRGWIPFSYTVDGSWTDFDPPAGPVSVLGMVRVPQERGSGLVSGAQDAEEGVLRSLARVDVGRLQQQVDEQLLPLYVDLRAQEPAQPGALPEPIPEPELDEGPHLSYAGQWFIFALLTLIFLPLFIRWTARRRLAPAPDETSEIVDLSTEVRSEGDGGESPGGGEPVATGPPPS